MAAHPAARVYDCKPDATMRSQTSACKWLILCHGVEQVLTLF